MTSSKLSSATKRLLAETPASEGDRPVDILIRVAGSLSSDLEGAIRALGGHVRTRAGDVVSLGLPLHQIDALAQLDSVIYVETAEPLFPESSDDRTGE